MGPKDLILEPSGAWEAMQCEWGNAGPHQAWPVGHEPFLGLCCELLMNPSVCL